MRRCLPLILLALLVGVVGGASSIAAAPAKAPLQESCAFTSGSKLFPIDDVRAWRMTCAVSTGVTHAYQKAIQRIWDQGGVPAFDQHVAYAKHWWVCAVMGYKAPYYNITCTAKDYEAYTPPSSMPQARFHFRSLAPPRG